MRILRATCTALLGVVVATGTAAADGEAGFYLGAGGGASWLTGADLSGRGPGALFVSGDTDTATGFDAGASIGYRYGPRLAAEIEYVYRTNGIDGVTAGGTRVVSDGDLSSTAVMVNGYWHFDGGDRWRPYLGAGLGYATEVDLDLERPGGGSQDDLEDSGFAVQVMAGVEYRVAPRWSLLAEGRFFTLPGGVELDNGGTRYDTDHDALSLRAGVRYRF